jgi:hypothetical protein
LHGDSIGFNGLEWEKNIEKQDTTNQNKDKFGVSENGANPQVAIFFWGKGCNSMGFWAHLGAGVPFNCQI